MFNIFFMYGFDSKKLIGVDVHCLLPMSKQNEVTHVTTSPELPNVATPLTHPLDTYRILRGLCEYSQHYSNITR